MRRWLLAALVLALLGGSAGLAGAKKPPKPVPAPGKLTAAELASVASVRSAVIDDVFLLVGKMYALTQACPQVQAVPAAKAPFDTALTASEQYLQTGGIDRGQRLLTTVASWEARAPAYAEGLERAKFEEQLDHLEIGIRSEIAAAKAYQGLFKSMQSGDCDPVQATHDAHQLFDLANRQTAKGLAGLRKLS